MSIMYGNEGILTLKSLVKKRIERNDSDCRKRYDANHICDFYKRICLIKDFF